MEKESQYQYLGQNLGWRPESNIIQRSVKAAKCLFQTPRTPGCLTLTASFAAISTLMCETDLSKLEEAKRQAIAEFINLTISADLFLDPVASRTSRGREGLIRFERFNRIREKVQGFKQMAKKAGYSEAILNSAIRWFDENRVLNFALCATFGNNGKIPWDRYLKNHSEHQNQVVAEEPISQSEKDFFEKVKKALEKCAPDQRAILLRAISSVSYAHALLCLTEQSSGVDPEKLRRIASMIGILQVIDDFATASKDKEDKINGIIAGFLNEEEINRLSSGRMKDVVAIARGTICGCLDEVGIDPDREWKKQIARFGILTTAAAATFWMSKRHGKTPYPLIPSVKAVISELFTPTNENDLHRIFSRQAMATALGFYQKGSFSAEADLPLT